MGKNSPKPPDPYETARAQGAMNRETAITQAGLNMVNQYTPGGTLEYTQNGTWEDGTPRYNARQTLSPDQQQLYDASNRIQGGYAKTAENQLSQLMSRLSQPFSTAQAASGQGAGPSAGPSPLRPLPGPGTQIAMSGGMDNMQFGDPSAPGSQTIQPPGPQLGGGGGMIRSLDMGGLPGLDSDASARNGVRYSLGGGAPIQSGFRDVGGTLRGFADVGGQQRGLDFSAFGDPNISRTRVEDALMQRLNPQLTQDRDALEVKLANQGLTPGTQAYDQAIDGFNRQVNDARLGAIMNAGGEQSRIFGLGLQQGQFANQGQERDYAQALGRASFANTGQAQDFGQARDRAAFSNQAQAQGFDQSAKDAAFWNAAQEQEFGQSLANAGLNNQARSQGVNERLAGANFSNTARQNTISEAIQERQQPLNELAALLSRAQVQGPSFVNTPQTGVQGVDLTGPTMQAYQQQLAQRNAMMGGLFGLGGAALAGGRFW